MENAPWKTDFPYSVKRTEKYESVYTNPNWYKSYTIKQSNQSFWVCVRLSPVCPSIPLVLTIYTCKGFWGQNVIIGKYLLQRRFGLYHTYWLVSLRNWRFCSTMKCLELLQLDKFCIATHYGRQVTPHIVHTIYSLLCPFIPIQSTFAAHNPGNKNTPIIRTQKDWPKVSWLRRSHCIGLCI